MDIEKKTTDGAVVQQENDTTAAENPRKLIVIDLPRRTYSRQNQDTSYQKVTQASGYSTHSN